MKKIFIIIIFLFLPFSVFAEQININTATLSQLDELTGIGPKYAQAIIDARPFSSVDDLVKVKGIGPKTLQKIKDQGFACINCLPAEADKTEQQKITTATSPATAPAITPPIIYPTGVFINELMPDPSGPDETDEWVEIFNSNNFDVDLAGWQLQDTQGTIATYKIQSKILANNFLVFKRPDTKIMLNNDSDGINLLTPDGKTEDSVNFTTAKLNQSYSKTSNGWKWSITLTPGAANIVTAQQIKTAGKTLPKTKISDNNKIELAAADLSQTLSTNQDTKTSNPWFLFFTVMATAIILAATVLLIKLKFQKNVRT